MLKHLKNYFIPHSGNDHKPGSVSLWSLGAIVGIAVVITFAVMVSSTTTSRNSFLANVQAAFLTQITNHDREERALLALKENPLLVEAAHLKAKDMLEHQYFAHVSPQGKEPWYWFKTVGYDFKYAGENLAVDFYDTKKVAQAWMDSPTHRANILNGNYSEIGIAVEVGEYKGREVAFVVQMFGTEKEPSATTSLAASLPQLDDLAPEKEAEPQVLGEETSVELEPAGKSFGTVDVNELPDIDATSKETAPVMEVAPEVSEKEDTTIEKIPYLKTQPGSFGKILLLILVGLVSLSLLLKVVIEIKKQHYKNVFFALCALGVLIALYLVFSAYVGQVTIV